MKDQAQGVATKTLEPDDDSVRDLISIGAHDLREPLRAIRLGAKILAANVSSPTDENVLRANKYISDGVDRVEELVRDIAEYCYAEVREPVFREVDLEMALLEARSELASELKAAGGTVLNGELPMVLGDAPALTAVFRALISNACKFRGDESPLVRVEAVRDRHEWVISVEDNGAGFDPVYRDRIFKPFERLNGKQYPGSGLGLTLARRIVQHHGGRIWAESDPGNGTVVRFSLRPAV